MTARTIPDFTYNGISLVRTCFAYPEQYEAYDESGRLVGYLRLRHGEFRVEVPNVRGTTVFTALPQGDGSFDESERDGYLIAAVEAIKRATAS